MTIRSLSSLAPALVDVALFFDVDGTLVAIEQEPDAVVVSTELRDTLRKLIERTDGAVALVSGRSIEQLDRLFAPLEFSASGLHGLERRLLPGDTVRLSPAQGRLNVARRRLRAFAEAHPGTFVEDKGLTLALHYRMAPEHREAAARMVGMLVDDGPDGLALLEGKMVFELKPPGYDKGRAIAAFMQDPPFRGRCPIFAGDDVTDEAGFLAINAMNGISIKVGDDGRPTSATHRLETVDAMVAWLQGLVRKSKIEGGEKA